MGAYRLFLAFCVLYSHVFGGIMGWNIGVVAVISFFVMSGYVMAILVSKHYPAIGDVPAFYKDRAARLFPQYILYMVATLTCVHMIGISDPFLLDTGPLHILLNALILPLGFYMFGLDNALYIPPAWSLGLEFSFYLVFPFFWRFSLPWKYALIIVSLAVAFSALMGLINTDWFGYRLLPGTFFIFAVGSALAKPETIGRYYPLLVLGLGLTALIVVLTNQRLYTLPYNREVMAGIVIGIVIVGALGKRRFSRFDELLSNLSYGVFLNHVLLMWLAKHFGISLFAVPLVSLALAYVTYNLVEKPALRWRHRLRQRSDISL